jgi:hypothetical protein
MTCMEPRIGKFGEVLAFVVAPAVAVCAQTLLLDLVRHNAEHVERHVKQILSIRAAYREFRAKQAVG